MTLMVVTHIFGGVAALHRCKAPSLEQEHNSCLCWFGRQVSFWSLDLHLFVFDT
jgi:hypothetical protein